MNEIKLSQHSYFTVYDYALAERNSQVVWANHRPRWRRSRTASRRSARVDRRKRRRQEHTDERDRRRLTTRRRSHGTRRRSLFSSQSARRAHARNRFDPSGTIAVSTFIRGGKRLDGH